MPPVKRARTAGVGPAQSRMQRLSPGAMLSEVQGTVLHLLPQDSSDSIIVIIQVSHATILYALQAALMQGVTSRSDVCLLCVVKCNHTSGALSCT